MEAGRLASHRSVVDGATHLQSLHQRVRRERDVVGVALSSHVPEAGRYAERVDMYQISLLHQGNGCSLNLGTAADGLQTVAWLAREGLRGWRTSSRRLRRFRRVLRHAGERRREAELGRVGSEAGPVGPLGVQHGFSMRSTVNRRGVLIAVRVATLRRAHRLEGCHVVTFGALERLLDEDLTAVLSCNGCKSDGRAARHLVGRLRVPNVDGSLILGAAARGVHGKQVVGACCRLVARVHRLHLHCIMLFLNREPVRLNVHHGAGSAMQGHALHALSRRLAGQRADGLVRGAAELGRGPAQALRHGARQGLPLDAATTTSFNVALHLVTLFEDAGRTLFKIQVELLSYLGVSLFLLTLDKHEERILLPVGHGLALSRRVGLQSRKPGSCSLSTRHLLPSVR